MAKKGIAAELVEGYLKKFPDTPDMTLAKIIWKEKENKPLFTNVETVRAMVRRYRGHSGDKSRKATTDKQFFKPVTYDTNPFKLPESRTVSASVFTLPTSIKKVLLMGDLHIPFHDNKAIQAAIDYGKKENVDCIYLNGDIADFYQCSFHEKDPRKVSISEELEATREFFAYLRNEFPKAIIYYIPGNHELRLERYLHVKAPELLNIDEFRLDVLLKVAEYNIIFIPHGSKVYFGKLLVEHGDKLRGSGGVNPARTLSLKLKRHSICGHFHRTTESITKVYDSDSIITYSVGCLCDLEQAYLPISDHNHGGAIVEMLGGGEFSVDNFKIVNGKIY